MPALEFRVALTTDDFDRVVAFYRDGLGLEPEELWTEGGRGQSLAAGRATLEIFDPAYAASVDQLEVGERVSGPVRLAVQVPDIHAALERALKHGATLVHEPILTPWKHLNARLRSPDGLQITIYQAQGD